MAIRRVRVVAGSLLLLHAVLLAVPSVRYGPRLDEVGHMAAGLSHWQTGDFTLYAVNPPLVRLWATAIPYLCGWRLNDATSPVAAATRAEFELGRQFAHNAETPLIAWQIARLSLIPVSLLGAWVAFRWSRELGGDRAGLLTLSLWTFSPNLLATGSSICPDMAAASIGLATLYLFRQWLTHPTWSSTVRFGVLLGLTELTKFTWITLLVGLPLVWLTVRIRQSEAVSWWREAAMGVAAGLIAWDVVVLGYAATDVGRPLGDFSFVSESLGGGGGNRFRETALAGVPFPLPAAALEGIDVQKRDFERGFRSYLLGEWKHGGWLHYYAVAMLVKTPIAFWPLLVWGLANLIRTPAGRPARADRWLLVGTAGGIFVFVSSQTAFSHHVRYVLPCLPPLLVIAGQSARQAGRVPLVLALLFAAESLSQFPNVQSFFTWTIGGPRAGRFVLVDSNLDWGQDVTAVSRWQNAHPEVPRPIGYLYFGFVDPSDFGVEYALPPPQPITPGDRLAAARWPDRYGPQPGWYAVSASVLMGIHYSVPNGQGGSVYVDDDRYGYFQDFSPHAVLAGSVYLFHISQEDVEKWSVDRRRIR